MKNKLKAIFELAKDSEALKPIGIDGSSDGYDDAAIGVSTDGRLVYSVEKMIEITVRDGDMSVADATEWLEYNTFNAYVGEMTPLWVYTEK
jgi:uncharacterized protein YaiE (UPF0345 family)